MIPSKTSKAEHWNFSSALLWNTFIWLTLMGLFSKIINGTAQDFLKERHRIAINVLTAERVVTQVLILSLFFP